jgi:hypothetical protein
MVIFSKLFQCIILPFALMTGQLKFVMTLVVFMRWWILSPADFSLWKNEIGSCRHGSLSPLSASFKSKILFV